MEQTTTKNIPKTMQCRASFGNVTLENLHLGRRDNGPVKKKEQNKEKNYHKKKKTQICWHIHAAPAGK
jgi:hypothetical protein